MTKPFSIAAIAATLLAGCAQSPPPAPDPAQLELVLAALEREESESSARFQKKIAAADRVSSSLARVAPDRLDIDAAAALVR